MWPCFKSFCGANSSKGEQKAEQPHRSAAESGESTSIAPLGEIRMGKSCYETGLPCGVFAEDITHVWRASMA